MNILEAIKSGKRFKREGWDKFHSKSEYPNIDFDIILADDWETEPESVKVTKKQLLRAYLDSAKTDDVKHGRIDRVHKMIKMLDL
jgi:hypothetical protein